MFRIGTINAQYQRITIGIDGFTCSMCAMSVEKSILSLPYIANVEMDINKSTAILYLKDGGISIRQIAKKVYDAGFSVRSIEADFLFTTTFVENYARFVYQNEEFHFLGIGNRELNGTYTIKFLNKRLISKKEFSPWEGWIKEDISKNGKNDQVYFVTLVAR